MSYDLVNVDYHSITIPLTNCLSYTTTLVASDPPCSSLSVNENLFVMLQLSEYPDILDKQDIYTGGHWVLWVNNGTTYS